MVPTREFWEEELKRKLLFYVSADDRPQMKRAEAIVYYVRSFFRGFQSLCNSRVIFNCRIRKAMLRWWLQQTVTHLSFDYYRDYKSFYS